MSIVVNEIRRGSYLDSVALMRISRQVAALPGVEEAGMMIGTPANRQILRDAGVLGPDGETAGPGDLILAIRATSATDAETALAKAKELLDAPRPATSSGSKWQPRSINAAVREVPDANLALISVPGDFAVAEARKALRAGLNVMMFSDNVPIAEEVTLKQEARDAGLLVMGPDCGTAIIDGAPLAFSNVIRAGDIGLIGASGTGLQEVTCLIDRAGRGITHAIGTGGRDLKADVGGITTLMALDLLDADPATRHIVLVSKPPAADVARRVLDRVAKSTKPVTVCFLGGDGLAMPANAKFAATLEAAAHLATGTTPSAQLPELPPASARNAGRFVRGLFCGGTLCAEAQIVFRQNDAEVRSNIPVPGAKQLEPASNGGHVLIDLGDDDYTRGRPHPMIEPAVRDAPLAEALADAQVGVVLLDIVLGYGGHLDPAGHLAGALANRAPKGPLIIASVTGTDADPQNAKRQIETLKAAGVLVAPSNAAAARLALAAVQPRR